MVGGGAYAQEVFSEKAEQDAIANSLDFELEGTQTSCIENAKKSFEAPDWLTLVLFAGAVGIIGYGYLRYKVVKEDIGTTSLIDDYL